jgi:phenylacetate-coenzyme A ligase PaaK-like adenylate-forming protein
VTQATIDRTTSGVEAVLAAAAAVPAFREKYADFVGRGPVELEELPILTKDELAGALDDLVEVARARPAGAYVYGSGGTTSAPKLSLIPSEMFVPEVLAEWRPLTPRDVLVNFNTPGRLWSSHNFFNMLAHRSGAVVIPLGSVEQDDELTEWLAFVKRLGATALDATPSHIAHILEFCRRTDRPPPPFRKLLWTGEGFGERPLALTRELAPDAELYGFYGSTETWVVGCNGPTCPVDTFHALRHQHVELQDGIVLVTNTHPASVNPILRYRIGDVGRFVACPCGRPEPALQLLGRDDPQFKFVSILVTPQEIAGVAESDPAVRAVQLALFRLGKPDEQMEVRLLVDAGTDRAETEQRVEQALLAQVYRLGWAVGSAPGSFGVRVVDELSVNPRTGKTPLVVHDEPARTA